MQTMQTSARLFLTLGAAAMLAAVVLGAFGAHALKERIRPDLLVTYHTAVEYHVYHALGLLAVGLAALHLPDSAWLRASGWAMAAGIVLFSGSLYLLAVTGVRALGAITPLGGAAFILAWALFLTAVAKAP